MNVVLFISKSKIQSESKSQQKIELHFYNAGCLSVNQRYNLKANHNHLCVNSASSVVIYPYVTHTI